MIELTQLSGKIFWINPHRIDYIEKNPDTTIVTADAKRIIVREDVPTVIERIVAYRRLIGHFKNEE